MCDHGTLTRIRVPIPAELSHTENGEWDERGVDSCIAPLVQALNDAGFYTIGCCCGHGRMDGSIALADGRELKISPFCKPMTPPLPETVNIIRKYFRYAVRQPNFGELVVLLMPGHAVEVLAGYEEFGESGDFWPTFVDKTGDFGYGAKPDYLWRYLGPEEEAGE